MLLTHIDSEFEGVKVNKIKESLKCSTKFISENDKPVDSTKRAKSVIPRTTKSVNDKKTPKPLRENEMTKSGKTL